MLARRVGIIGISLALLACGAPGRSAAPAKIAKCGRLSPAELDAATRRQELEPGDLRELVHRQLLVAKLWSLGPGKAPLSGLESEPEKRAAMIATYETWKAEPGRARADVRVLAFYVAPGTDRHVTESLASLRARAEAGEDFCSLVKTYAHDDSTRNSCGSLGPLPLVMLLPAIRAAVETMKPMEVRGPLAFGEGRVIFQLVERPHVPALEEVFGEIWRITAERVRREALVSWLRGLGRTYGLRGGELSHADEAMLEAEVLRARNLRTPEERSREAVESLATEIIRNVLREGPPTRAPGP